MLIDSYSWLEILLLIITGVLAGIINTLAGSGTIFTFGAMLFLDIPIVLANTTNRVGVVFQNISATYAYFRFGTYSWKQLKLGYLMPTLAGALLGAFWAVDVSEGLLNGIAGAVMFLLLVKFTLKFPRGLRTIRLFRFLSRTSPSYLVHLVFFVIGIYGGFIQIGIGLLLISAISHFSAASLKTSNITKLIIITIYTIPTTLYFALQGKIIWVPAMLLSLGQIMGAFAAGAFANLSDKAEFWIKNLLRGMISLTLVKVILF